MIEPGRLDQHDIGGSSPVLKMFLRISLRIVDLRKPLAQINPAPQMSESRRGNGRRSSALRMRGRTKRNDGCEKNKNDEDACRKQNPPPGNRALQHTFSGSSGSAGFRRFCLLREAKVWQAPRKPAAPAFAVFEGWDSIVMDKVDYTTQRRSL